MLLPRVIPVLLLRGRGLYKTVRFRDPVYLGDPVNAVRVFNEKEVDELIVLDIEVTKQRRPPDHELLAEFSSEAFMPVTYGGGVRTVDDFGRLYELGVEKVAVNTLLRDDPDVVTSAASKFGEQSVVASLDVRRRSRWRPEPRVWWHATRTPGPDPVELAQQAVSLGAGELLVTSVDREGTREGLDLSLVARLSEAVDTPVIAHGGVGTVDHIKEGFAAGASAVACGSLFSLHGRRSAVLLTYLNPSERATLVEKS